MMKRENFQSRLGFLLVSAGCAIGIGNVWKFPYVTGANGGGVFVLFYLLFLITMGVPVLTMELAVGRASRKSAVQGYQALEPAGSRWHLHGWFCVAGCYLLMMYYTTVSGWMLGYFFKFAAGTFTGLQGDAIDGVFGAMLGSPGEMTAWMVLTVLAGFLVVSFGLQKGLERITKVMMLGLLGLILVLAVHSLTLEGAAEGVKFYLLPDFGRAVEAGLGSVIVAAMNQAFFTLSLGIAAMEILLTPAILAAMRIAGFTFPSLLGGVQSTISLQPAILAGVASISTVLKRGAVPPGIYNPTFSIATLFCQQVTPAQVSTLLPSNFWL